MSTVEYINPMQHVSSVPLTSELPTSPTLTRPIATEIIGAEDLWFGEIPKETMELIDRIYLERFLVLVKQVNIKLKTKGGIIVPDSVADGQLWTHGLVQIVKCGVGCWKGRRFEDMGISENDKPEPGDLAIINAKVPNRITIDGIKFFCLPDDGIFMRIAREDIQRISFTIE